MLAALRERHLPDHRPTPEDQVHLTLCFIGDTPRRDVDEVRESVARSAAGLPAFDLAPRRLITLPDRARPRLVAVETDAPPTILELVRRLTTRLAKRVREKPTDRYLPHLTLCRFSHTSHPTQLSHDIALPPFAIREIVLVQSKLTPAGAVHAPVESFRLTER
jgi:2'-5' RNA ligase